MMQKAVQLCKYALTKKLKNATQYLEVEDLVHQLWDNSPEGSTEEKYLLHLVSLMEDYESRLFSEDHSMPIWQRVFSIGFYFAFMAALWVFFYFTICIPRK